MAKKEIKEAFSQLYLAKALEGEVQGWVDQGWPGVTQTTLELFNYWFQREEYTDERFYACQRRAIETVVYCYEILQAGTLQELFERVAPETLYQHLPLKQEVETIPFTKYALKMATGSGKTWVLASLLVWQYFNRINNEREKNYSCRFLVVTPGHEVLNRLLDSFKGKRDPKTGNRNPEASDYKRSLFIPEGANWRDRFHLEILEPDDVKSNTTPPDGPFVFLTNWQQFRLKSTAPDLWAQQTGADVEEMPRGEIILDFLSNYPDLIIMNDEAHHVHGKKGTTGEELKWRQFMNILYDRLKESYGDKFGPFLQIDYSATPFYGSREKREYFPHIVYDYELLVAMQDMLVKQLFLEERQSIGGESLDDLDFRAERCEPEGSHRRGEIKCLSAGQKLLLEIGRLKLEQLSTEFKEKGLNKKSVMMVLCEDTKVADLTAEHFATRNDERGNYYDDKQVMVIHSALPEKKLDEARLQLDKIDVDDDPLRVIISVLMLREGFDKNNICVTVVLRATEADLLLEQIVGRGLRLMFPAYSFPELQDAKRDAFSEIRRNKIPSNSLDFLFVVEHPRFRAFYESLKREGYVIPGGDTSGTTSTGDLMSVDAITERIEKFDIAWPIQVYDEGRMPELSQIDVATLPKYGKDFRQLKEWLSKLIVQETHVETGKKTRTWKLDNEYFDFFHFLRQASKAIATRGKTSILTAKQAEIAELIDNYVSEYCFGESIDFTRQENYSVLNYSDVFDYIVQTVHKAIVKLIEGYKYEVKGVWGKLSEVPRIMVRESKSIETDKSIYPRMGYQIKGGGFERDFMLAVLNPSADVFSYAKLDRRHKLKITYRDETGISRNYEVDFVVKTPDKMYLVETKADKDIESPNVAVKARAAVAWCEQASTLLPLKEYNQPQNWEYLILSEGIFSQNRGLGFEGFVSLCRGMRDRIIAQAESRLFV
ncbi:MAG: DEAD/DEAH box helicase family protein [Candidatus Stahlbacteria bacterium]|nr:DEAD/DEAH box helicase family protein [Candidatus Stahlbacteria bacterium]